MSSEGKGLKEKGLSSKLEDEKANSLNNMTQEQISKIDKGEIANFTESQFNALSEAQFNELSEDQRSMIDPEVLKKLEHKFDYAEASFDGARSERGKSAGNMSPAPAQGQDTAPAPGQVIYNKKIKADDLQRQYIVDGVLKALKDMSKEEIKSAKVSLNGPDLVDYHKNRDDIHALENRLLVLENLDKEFQVNGQSKKLKDMSFEEVDSLKSQYEGMNKLRIDEINEGSGLKFMETLKLLGARRAELRIYAPEHQSPVYATTSKRVGGSKTSRGDPKGDSLEQGSEYEKIGGTESRSRAGSGASLGSDGSHYSRVDDGEYEFVGDADDDIAPPLPQKNGELDLLKAKSLEDQVTGLVKAFDKKLSEGITGFETMQDFLNHDVTKSILDDLIGMHKDLQTVAEFRELMNRDLEQDGAKPKKIGDHISQIALFKSIQMKGDNAAKEKYKKFGDTLTKSMRMDVSSGKSINLAIKQVRMELREVAQSSTTTQDADGKKPQGKQNKPWKRVKNAWGAVQELRKKSRTR